MSEDLILQVFARLAIIVAERDCDKDNNMKYHIDYENKRYDVTIEIGDDRKMKDIDGYVTKDDLYRLISRIKRNPDVADDKTCHTIVNAISDMPAADVQPVVRCKDCKYRTEHHYEEEGEPPYIKYGCKFTKYSMSDEGFCSFGVRKEGK